MDLTKRNEDRTKVKSSTSCSILFDGDAEWIPGMLENISPGGACLFFQDSSLNREITENMKGTLKVGSTISEKVTVAWYFYGRVGLMFDKKLPEDVVSRYQKS